MEGIVWVIDCVYNNCMYMMNISLYTAARGKNPDKGQNRVTGMKKSRDLEEQSNAVYKDGHNQIKRKFRDNPHQLKDIENSLKKIFEKFITIVWNLDKTKNAMEALEQKWLRTNKHL